MSASSSTLPTGRAPPTCRCSRATPAHPALGSYGTPEPGWEGSNLYTTQVYQKWPGDVESYSSIIQKSSVAKNFNLQLDYDDGGPFTAPCAASVTRPGSPTRKPT